MALSSASLFLLALVVFLHFKCTAPISQHVIRHGRTVLYRKKKKKKKKQKIKRKKLNASFVAEMA